MAPELVSAVDALRNDHRHGPLRASADTWFANFKSQAKAANFPLSAYHFLYPHGSASITSQVDTCVNSVGDESIAVMIDHEPDGSGAPIPSVTDHVNFIKGLQSNGFTVHLSYLPHWVWNNMGSPSLAPLANLGLSLTLSSYVAGSGLAASSLYPGSGAWPAAYGGMGAKVWQFTDAAAVAGFLVDANATELSLAETVQLLTNRKDGDMPIIFLQEKGFKGIWSGQLGGALRWHSTQNEATGAQYWANHAGVAWNKGAIETIVPGTLGAFGYRAPGTPLPPATDWSGKGLPGA